jgi:hypothetical protein
MEHLHSKYTDVLKVHKALAKSIERYHQSLSGNNIDEDTVDTRRDSVIKHFDLTHNLLWKYIRKYINVTHGSTANSSRSAFQQCFTLGLLNVDELQQLINLTESYKASFKAYDIDIAKALAANISERYDGINAIIAKLAPDNIKNNQIN